MSVSRAIVDAFLSEHPFYWITEGIVKSVSKTDRTCEITLRNNKDKSYKNVRWYLPILPKKNAKCFLVFRDNLESRATAFAFSEWDEIKTTIGEKTDIEINDDGVLFSHGNTKIEIATSGNLKVSNGSLSLELSKTNNEWIIEGDLKIKGKLEVTKDVTFEGKLDVTKDISSEAEVVANSKATKTTLSKHIHPTSAPGAPTSPPTPGT